jgi:rubrerythrin
MEEVSTATSSVAVSASSEAIATSSEAAATMIDSTSPAPDTTSLAPDADLAAAAAGLSADTADTEHPSWSQGALSVIFSNLAKGCEKQYRPQAAEWFQQLSAYYANQATLPVESSFSSLQACLEADLSSGYVPVAAIAAEKPDRGAQRALVWGEKVSRMQTSVLSRYDKQGDAAVSGTNLYVCEICGFLYLGDEPPEICPVCKVPSMKIRKLA